jgi:tetratricopeptide (TPR) repeat protein
MARSFFNKHRTSHLSKIKNLSWTLLLVLMVEYSCSPPVIFTPLKESEMLEQVIQEEARPRRKASLRLVQQGQKELIQNHMERAARSFSDALGIDSQNPFAYFYLGKTRFLSSRWQEAAELFGKANHFYENENFWKAEALAFQGESLEKLGQKNEARVFFEKAVNIESSNLRAQNGLSRINE